MIRIIILALLAYLAYRAVKAWMYPDKSSTKVETSNTAGQIDDVMIKDPYCEAYFPRRKGVHARVDGQDLYFCSAECKEKYIENRKQQRKKQTKT
jgi:YHS domain-containing protein